MGTDRKPRYGNLTSGGVSTGYEFAGAVIVFILLGLLLDSVFHTKPWFTIGFIAFGSVAGFLRLMHNDKYVAARRERRGLAPVEQRETPAELVNADKQRSSASERGETTGIDSFGDWRPRRFGDPVPDGLRRVGGEAQA